MRALYIGRMFGIDIGLDVSWIIVFVLVTVSLHQTLGIELQGWSAASVWFVSLLTSLLFFLSLLLHEIGHSVTSNALGVPIRSITLFIFGGVAQLTREPDRPRDEFLIAVAGPLVSLVLGVGLIFGAGRVPTTSTPWLAAATVAQIVGEINLVLLVFNCFPGFPLDGGRVLRALIWRFTGDFKRATKVAAGGGFLFAIALITLGTLNSIGVFGEAHPLAGVWMVLIGVFLFWLSRMSILQAVLKDSLGRIRVRDIQSRHLPRISGAISVAQIMEGPYERMGDRSLLVERDGDIIGHIDLFRLHSIPNEERESTPAQAVMSPSNPFYDLSPEETIASAIRKMDYAAVDQLPVVENGLMTGLITREAIRRVMRNQLRPHRSSHS